MTHFVSTQISQHGYLAIFLLMLLESACIPIPSEAIMLFGGALAGGLVVAGSTADVSVWEVALVGAAGNVVGSLIAYGVGRYGGPAILQNPVVTRIIRPKHVHSAERFFERRGSWAVLVGRLLPVIRTFISLPAGIARMLSAGFRFSPPSAASPGHLLSRSSAMTSRTAGIRWRANSRRSAS